ncbi:hypothetical protein BDZ89DRAFT_1060370 [Hymenopellis radicata]|nr:hypothetical protein BDZ89DRAFT_1060370 [Hymenopellis radicata]
MSSSPSLTLYDIPSKSPQQPWSPNTWKTRYALNYKGLPHQTVWVEYPDIADLYKKNGAEACEIKNGAPHYTLPLLHDASTGKFVSDSTAIAQYLEATYPDTPRLFPEGSSPILARFRDELKDKLGNLRLFAYPKTYKVLNPSSAEYFRRARELEFGKRLEDIKAGMGDVAGWMKKDGKFFLGDTLCYADILAASYLMWIRAIFGKGSEEWADIMTWQDGRWATFMKDMEKYETVV